MCRFIRRPVDDGWFSVGQESSEAEVKTYITQFADIMFRKSHGLRNTAVHFNDSYFLRLSNYWSQTLSSFRIKSSLQSKRHKCHSPFNPNASNVPIHVLPSPPHPVIAAIAVYRKSVSHATFVNKIRTHHLTVFVYSFHNHLNLQDHQI